MENIAQKTLTPAQLVAVARTFKLLSDPTRLAILQQLMHQPLAVHELVARVVTRQANVSKQLGLLHAGGLVERRREGNHVIYFVSEPLVRQLCELVCSKLKRDASQLTDSPDQ